jgi:chromosome segregation ATPase
MQQRNKPTQTRLDPALSLVECSVRVSATLARLMRKCATLEASGTSAQDALLASAGFQAGEIEALRTRAKQSEEELKLAREREAQLQLALDQAKTTIAQRDKELKDTRQILNKTAETEKGSRQSTSDNAGSRRVCVGLFLCCISAQQRNARTMIEPRKIPSC